MLQIIISYYLSFYILKKSKKINDLTIKKVIKLFFIIAMIYYPLILMIFFKGFPFVRQYFPYFSILVTSFHYFIINIFWLYFVSKFLHFPKIRFVDEKFDLNIFSNIYSISGREREIVELLIEGLSYKEIGDKLFISFQTVKTHLKNIYKKVNVQNKMQLSTLIRKCSN